MCSFVYPSVQLFVPFFSFSVTDFDFLMVFKECLKFKESFQEGSRIFQGWFKGVSRKTQENYKRFSRNFQEMFKGIKKD